MEIKSLIFRMMVVSAIISQMPGVANAADKYWVCDVNDWFNAGCWDPTGVPGLDDSAYIDNGGTAQITSGSAGPKYVNLGHAYGSSGYISLSSTGQLAALGEVVGGRGIGIFYHNDGNNFPSSINIGDQGESEGTYNLGGGHLMVNWVEHMAYAGTGYFNHTGGIHDVNFTLFIAAVFGSTGTYELSGTGQLTAAEEFIGYEGVGIFNQMAGTHTVWGTLTLGSEASSTGTYTISGGTLNANHLRVGWQGRGSFNIDSPAASIRVSEKLFFGTYSTFTAEPNSTIHMEGASFDIYSTNEPNLSDFNDLTLIFERGAIGGTCTFEVAGVNDGGFSDNFAFGEVNIGGSEEFDVNVQLVDNWNNGNRGNGYECLFVHELVINQYSELDINGLKLYVSGDVNATLDSYIDDDRIFDSTPSSGPLDAVYDPMQDWTYIESSSCIGRLEMDFNTDCKVDFKDFALFAQSWLECTHPNCEP